MYHSHGYSQREAVHHGKRPPVDTKMLWWDISDSSDPKLKYWDEGTLNWEVYTINGSGGNGGTTPVVEIVPIVTKNVIPSLAFSPVGSVIVNLKGWSSSTLEGAITVNGSDVVWNRNVTNFDILPSEILRFEYER